MMKLYPSIIVFILCVYRSITTCNTSTDLGSNVYEYLGTRTPYRFRYNKNESVISYPECKDLKIWMLIRHGTRLPSIKDIVAMHDILTVRRDHILAAHNVGKGHLNQTQIARFQQWSTDLVVENSKDLALEGRDEMIQLAERTMKRFPNAVKRTYSNESFYFRYTPTQRAQQSAVYFTRGLFTIEDSRNVSYAPIQRTDTVLRFYKYCDKWQKQVKKNPNTYAPQKLYAISKDMKAALKSVSKKLGFNETLPLGDVSLMYKICGFETAWDPHNESPWCYGFDTKTAEVFEYYYDLKHYWLDGYGHPMTRHQACFTMKNMLENMGHLGGPTASFLFSHSGMILKLITHLGLYEQDSPLLASKLQQDRAWRTSYIDSFGANIAFVLYKCKKELFLLTLHQERRIKLPMCKHKLCPLTAIQSYFDLIHKCNMNSMCDVTETDDPE